MAFNLQQAMRQRHGAVGESHIEARLVAWGFVLVEKVHTPWKVLFGKGGRIVRAFPVEKVCGDFRAVMRPSGRSVLVEVKSRESGPLSWTDFEAHQHAAMKAHSDAGGLTLIGWCRPGECLIFTREQAIAVGWQRGDPLHPEAARTIAHACRSTFAQ